MVVRRAFAQVAAIQADAVRIASAAWCLDAAPEAGVLGVRVSNKLAQQRSLPEGWAMEKHMRERGASDIQYLKTQDERLEALAKAKALVERGYVACKPRRELLATLGAAMADLGDLKRK